MNLRVLRRIAFLAALVACIAIAAILAVRLAIDGPSPTLAAMVSGLFVALFALAGVYPYRR